jgi:hypothetical protein
MPNIPKQPQTTEEFIEELTQMKFGVNSAGIGLGWQRSAGKSGFITADVKVFQDELRKLNTDELRTRHNAEVHKQTIAIQEQYERQEAERFFNQPYVNADFAHWSKAAYWTVEESIALSFGKDPARVNWESIKSAASVSRFAIAYGKRRDLAKRAVVAQQLSDPCTPGFFLGWAKRNSMDFPQTLAELVEKGGQTIADWPELLKQANKRTEEAYEWGKKKYTEALEAGRKNHAEALALGRQSAEEIFADWKADREKLYSVITQLNAEIEQLKTARVNKPTSSDKPLNPKSRISLLKLVLGMGIDGYGYKPKAERSPIPREVCDALANIGITIDEDTVRSWLQQATEEIGYTSPDLKTP